MAALSAAKPVDIWASNAPAYFVLQRMPWLPGPSGVFGLDWSQLEPTVKDLRIKRRDRKGLRDLLRHAESAVLDWHAEQARLNSR